MTSTDLTYAAGPVLDEPVVEKTGDDDEGRLMRLGHKQELKRNYTFWSCKHQAYLSIR